MFARLFNRICCKYGICASLIGALAAPAGAVTIYGHGADRSFSAISESKGTNENPIYVGRKGSGDANKRTSVFIFDLSSITEPIEGATLYIYYSGASGTKPDWNVDLYAVGYLEATEDEIWFPENWGPAGDLKLTYYEGGSQAGQDINNGFYMLADNLVTKDTVFGYVSVSSDDLVTVLNNRPEGADWVFFRLNADEAHNTQHRFYEFRPNHPDTPAAQLPKLELVIPEPGAIGLLSLGAVAAAVRRPRHRTQH